MRTLIKLAIFLLLVISGTGQDPAPEQIPTTELRITNIAIERLAGGEWETVLFNPYQWHPYDPLYVKPGDRLVFTAGLVGFDANGQCFTHDVGTGDLDYSFRVRGKAFACRMNECQPPFRFMMKKWSGERRELSLALEVPARFFTSGQLDFSYLQYKGKLELINQDLLATVDPADGPENDAVPQVNYGVNWERQLHGGCWEQLFGVRWWRPKCVASGWRPFHHGYWYWTRYGWTWRSLDPWGYTTSHYGVWRHHSRFGWLWRPTYRWAPCRVTFYAGKDWIGWAPYYCSAIKSPFLRRSFRAYRYGYRHGFTDGYNRGHIDRCRDIGRLRRGVVDYTIVRATSFYGRKNNRVTVRSVHVTKDYHSQYYRGTLFSRKNRLATLNRNGIELIMRRQHKDLRYVKGNVVRAERVAPRVRSLASKRSAPVVRPGKRPTTVASRRRIESLPPGVRAPGSGGQARGRTTPVPAKPKQGGRSIGRPGQTQGRSVNPPNQPESGPTPRKGSKPASRRWARPSTPSTTQTPARRVTPAPARRSTPTPTRRVTPAPTRRSTPTPARRATPTPTRRSTPTPTQARRSTPTPTRRATPAPTRRSTPAPARRRAAPTPTRRSTPTPTRRATPAPTRRSTPTPARRRAAPTPTRRSTPTPTRRAAPAPTRRSTPAPARRATPTPTRRSSPAPARRTSTPTRRPDRRDESDSRRGRSGRRR